MPARRSNGGRVTIKHSYFVLLLYSATINWKQSRGYIKARSSSREFAEAWHSWIYIKWALKNQNIKGNYLGWFQDFKRDILHNIRDYSSEFFFFRKLLIFHSDKNSGICLFAVANYFSYVITEIGIKTWIMHINCFWLLIMICGVHLLIQSDSRRPCE